MSQMEISLSDVGFTIVLGRKCNLHCKYCAQEGLHREDVKDQCIDGIIEYLRNIRAQNGDENLSLEFYGGEPLLYMKEIEWFVEHLGGGFDYSVTSNGRLLDMDKIKFLNEYCFDVIISYDGKQSKSLRGFDVVKEKRAELLSIESLTLHAVLTKGASSAELLENLKDLNGEYQKRHGYELKVTVSPLVPFGELESYSTEDYRKDIKRIFEIAAEQPLAQRYVERLIKRIRGAIDGEIPGGAFDPALNCRFGTMIPISLDGKIHSCVNLDHPVSSIDDSLETAIEKIAKENMTERMERCSKCKFCGVTCKNAGCPMQSDEVFDKYCKSAKERGEVLLEVLDEVSKKKL